MINSTFCFNSCWMKMQVISKIVSRHCDEPQTARALPDEAILFTAIHKQFDIRLLRFARNDEV